MVPFAVGLISGNDIPWGVGRIVGIPQSTVKTRMFYARRQLAELLKSYGVETLAA